MTSMSARNPPPSRRIRSRNAPSSLISTRPTPTSVLDSMDATDPIAATPAKRRASRLHASSEPVMAKRVQTHRAVARPKGITSESVGSGVDPASLPVSIARAARNRCMDRLEGVEGGVQ